MKCPDRLTSAAVAVLRDPEVELLAYLAAARTVSRRVEPDVRNVKSDPTAMIVFGRIMRTGTAKELLRHRVWRSR